VVFSSSIFLFAFFPIFFGVYYLVPPKYRNAVIVFFSILIYSWGARSFIIIVVGTLVIDYLLGNVIAKKPKYLKLCVAVDIVMNVGIVIYFKYSNFFMDNINTIMASVGLDSFVFSRVILPLGVSFVMFQKMTYCLDIARGIAAPAEKFFYLLEYLMLFPHTVAGPIIKYNQLAHQIIHRELNWETFIYGFKRFAVGLFKKVWIADVFAKYANVVFNASGGIPIDYAWVGMIAYTFQIYFDFSGYSDMAIGMLSMMGFHINENFNMPYISSSITEFWKRWHISMTSWFREYIYFPLGGNRNGKVRTYINQWIVFLISGFWHGAAWNFIFWGAYHGTILCAEKAFLLKAYQKIHPIFRWAITMLLVMIGWVFFRANDIGAGFRFLASMASPGSYFTHVNPSEILVIDPRGWFIFALAALICLIPFFFPKTYERVLGFFAVRDKASAAIVLCLFALTVLKVITGSISPFIYFRF
jgi:alginate O-acetyltransferase complex protein AlgI